MQSIKLTNSENSVWKRKTMYSCRKKPIVALTMCDDLLVISECGYKTNLAVSYINSQARINYLQFGLSKCSKMQNIGKTKQKYCIENN